MDGSSGVRYHKRDFWGTENLKFTEPHFRMRKAARQICKLARGRELDLLDVGCGPAALAGLLPANLRYHGIDIAIQDPAPNLVEADFAEQPIASRGVTFDIIVAQGVFGYMGDVQSQKLAEIAGTRALKKRRCSPVPNRSRQVEGCVGPERGRILPGTRGGYSHAGNPCARSARPARYLAG